MSTEIRAVCPQHGETAFVYRGPAFWYTCSGYQTCGSVVTKENLVTHSEPEGHVVETARTALRRRAESR